MRGWSILALGAVCAALCSPAFADRDKEGDPWANEPPQLRERMEELGEREAMGDIGPDDLRELNKYWATHLRRCPMNALNSAQYSAAEIHLQRGDATSAVAALQKALASAGGPEVKNLTHLNLGEVYRRRLNDLANAAKHYRQVEGILRCPARQYMLTMFAETGKLDEAAKLIDELVAQAKEKGEKLVLLHRLAALYKQFQMPDQSLAVYERIAKEFTAEDMKQIQDAVLAEVRGALGKLEELRRRDDGDEADRIEEQMKERARELQLAGRWDELKVFKEAWGKGREEMRARERERERQEKQEQERKEREKAEREKAEREKQKPPEAAEPVKPGK